MDFNPTKAVEYIMKHSSEFAKAKAERVYIENFLRSKKSILMASAKATTISGAEAEAYAHPDYIGLLDGLKQAVETEENIKWMLTAAQLKVEIWRTQQANDRQIERLTR